MSSRSAAGGSPPAADLTPFVPRLIPQWMGEAPEARHRAIPGTLVFTDLSGFTAMSERLAALGKVGAEELTHHLDATFTELVAVSGALGGTMLKFGGDALLLFFWGDQHEVRAARAAVDMQSTLERVGRISTTAGDFQLQMTVGAHRADVDFFLVGSSHRELFVCGPGTTETVRIEGSASPGEVRVSAELAATLDLALVDRTGDIPLLLAAPAVETGFTAWPVWPSGITPNRFVPEMLRNHLTSGVELREHRQMVIGFVHLANVDELLLEIGPEATALHLDDFVAFLQHVFAVHDVAFVSTDVYEGGPKIICATGAVRTFENDDERLLRALREVADYPSPIELRMGVNRGHGFCGYVGPPFRRTFVTIGDVVNTAARVMSKAGPSEILSTAGPLDRSETAFVVEELPPFAAKGKAEPLVAYRVGEVLGTVAAGERLRLPLIGREAELARLRSALEDVRAGPGRFIEVRGETGIGKTRLLEEFVQDADVPVSEARCGRYAGSTPYFPFRTILSELIGGPTVEVLGGRVAAHAPALEPYMPLLALLLGHTRAPTAEIERLSQAEQRAKLHETFLDFVRSITDGPQIWLVEDAHWVDAASADLLRYLAANVDSLPALVCVTRRSDDAEPFGTTETVLDLHPLREDAAHALLETATDAHLLPHELERLGERAHGNPYFLIELARVPRDLEHLPESLEALVAAQIDALAPADRLLLRQLAVVGSRFDPRVAAEAVEGLPGPRDKRWIHLDEFLDRTVEPWRFHQTLVRDTAYEGLSYRERRGVHERAGVAIERNADDPSMLCELLSLHFHAAENHGKALRYSTAAAEKARRSYALSDAGIFFNRCVNAARALGDDQALGDALTGLGHAELDQGQFVQARGHYQESLEIKRALGNAQGVAAQLNGLGLVARMVGEYAAAEEFFEECLAILRTLPNPETLGAVLQNLGVVAWYQGKTDEASAWFEQSLAASEAEGNRVGVAQSLDNLGMLAFAVSDLTTAQSRFDESLRMKRELGDKPGIALSLHNLGSVALQRGDRNDARPYLEESLTLRREIGDRRGVSITLLSLGTIAYYAEDYDRARESYEQSLGIVLELGDRPVQTVCLHNLGEIALIEGDLAGARGYCEQSLKIRREIGDPRPIAETLTTLGTIASELGEGDQARGLYLEAVEIHHELGNKIGLAECLEAVAATCAALGDAPRAATLLGAVDAILESSGAARSWSEDRRAQLDASLRDRLGDSVFEMTFEVGRAMSLDRALDLARGFLGSEEPVESATA